MLRRPLVLVVEDDYSTLELLQSDLVRFGCSVCETATTIAEAIAGADRHRPCLAVVDVTLRRGDSGIEAALEIGRKNGTKIIFLTDDNEPDIISRMLPVGPIGILPKPYDRERLRQAILAGLRPAVPF